jgi:tRNA(Ile)-lysidine synthase
MKYIVAVSGGVDSMVLLDMMVRAGGHELIVAHFDHGIRPDSRLDAQLVQNVAQQHGLQFETKREELGASAGEALARDRRYAFLRSLARKHDATIVTAHHLDDLVETVAINMTRGTGWRGLAVLDSGMARPLIDMEKATLVEYARKRGIEWREDSTNATPAYLRNRIRMQSHMLQEDAKREMRALHAHQKVLKRAIKEEVQALVGDGPWYSRYFFTHVQSVVALECLREITHGKLTRPQLARVLHAIKVAKPNSTFEAGDGIRFYFSTRQFSL